MTATPAASGTGQEVSVYQLRPAPPIRAFLLAGIGSILGAVVIVLSRAQGWHGVVTALGVLLLVLGLVLLGGAFYAMTRMQVKAELTPTGYSFRTPAGVRHGTWADTVKVTTSESGRRITFHRRDESLQHVVTPVGSTDSAMRRLTTDITDRLKRSRAIDS